MQYVLLAYGAAFLATGLALGLQARATAGRAAIPRAALWLAAAFAIVHGASDWLQLSFFLEQREHGVPFVRLCAARVRICAESMARSGEEAETIGGNPELLFTSTSRVNASVQQ